ncbi:MAG: phenylalanine--tRNA ligase subunit alpha [Sandaracinus sp.]|nr:phenylalanine--tRNA ligase subunit alpha [Sandaracinus sp.]MCB9619440.1 phenylalanine--tRNA ligase subunit alpha [Sandaracinus sp.]
MSDAVSRFDEGLRSILTELEGGAFEVAKTEQELREINARFVGANGSLTSVLKLMRELPGDQRKPKGQAANEVKQKIEARFSARLDALLREAREADLKAPFDVTLPGRGVLPGRLHPITRVRHELLDIFESLGFEVVDGPEIDLHENCFDRLGFPPDHPATDMQDTFFVDRGKGAGDRGTLLRTHTSTMQIREMSRRPPPLAVVSAGAVYRRDDDATHSPMFHQIEGFLVDEKVTMADLKGVLQRFLERLYGEAIEVRLRPSYFPFVEPGAEVDARRPGGSWMEIGGCGMIHPVVFEHVGYDPTKVSGFAFGMGIDRMAMVKFGVPNIKLLFENDVRFLGGF